MLENKREFSNHIMFKPMSKFLALLKKDADSFLDSVQKKEEFVIEMLRTLHHMGFYHILIPLYELMPYYLTVDILSWWKGKISELENYNQMAGILDSFHEKAVQYTLERFPIEESYVWSFYSPLATMEELLWDSYCEDVDFWLKQNAGNNIGILIPGLYHTRLSENYIVSLETYAFPCLIDCMKQHYDYQTASDTYEMAAIKWAIEIYSGELGWRYYTAFLQSSNRVLKLEEKKLADMRYMEYKKLLLRGDKEDNIADYLSDKWIAQLRELLRCAGKLLLNESEIEMLNNSLPVLMQCAGHDDDANDCLLEMLEHMNVRDRSCEVLLLGLYRAVAKTRFNNHSEILSRMNAIFNTGRIPSGLIDVLEDILKFYKAFSEELSRRFKKETLEELIYHANEGDKPFYRIYSFYCEHDDEDIEDIKWIYDCLFSDNRLVSRLETGLNIIKNPGSKYSAKILHIQLLHSLFMSLTSHLSQEVRIAVRPCFTYLGIDEAECPVKKNEIFMVYSRSQHLRLRELAKRLEQEMAHIPAYSTVEEFERLQFEGSEVTRQMVEKIADEVHRNKERIEQIEIAQEYYNIIHNYILQYASMEDGTLNSAIMEALVNNKELTLEFCNSIHEICQNSKTMKLSAENIAVLEKTGRILESAVSHPEGYQNKIVKKEFLSAIECFASCIPGAGNILSLTKGMRALKKVFDTLGEEGVC